MFTVISFQVMPINSLAVPSPTLGLYCFCTSTFYFIRLNFLSVEIVDISSKALEICHTHQAYKFPLRTFNGKLRTFLMVKSKMIEFLLNWTQQYTSVLFGKTPRELLPEKIAAKQPLRGFFRGSWHVLHYMVHVTPLCVLWKLLKAFARTISSVIDMRLTSRLSRKCKDKTKRCCKDH